ncbi:hypothetical protein [Uliginosibacterium gangwonense]|uniref:hypothetical protein n=1 Tax=Uliginosibacterium gangwonense TaxID=392736 RepID=UPI00036DB825|nr:hypothetical protein [Uliginosibacterium gangwonense]
MSLAIYPVFEQPLETDEFDPGLGEALAANIEVLEEIADDADLVSLSVLADSREVPVDFDGDSDELIDLLGPSTEWNDAGEGLIVVLALLNHLKTTPDAAAELSGGEGVIEELEELARILQAADAEGVRFRLEIG